MLNQLIAELAKQANKDELINGHHLAGFLYYYHKDLIPNNSFSHTFRQQWGYNNILKQKVIKLHDHGLNFIPLKGISLLDQIYPEIGSRFMSDVDLLISENDLPLFRKVLLIEGFSLLSSKQWNANSFKEEWSLYENNVQINFELHTQLFYHHTEPWAFYLQQCNDVRKGFDPEFNFVYLAGHLAFQHTFIKLYWLIDLYLIYQKYNNTWNEEKILGLAEVFKLKKSVQFIFSLFSHFNGDKYHPFFLDHSFLLNPHKSLILYFLLKHLTKDHLSDAFIYDLKWLNSKVR